MSLFQVSCSVSGITRVLADGRHEVRVPRPARQHVQVDVPRDPRPRRPAQVGAHVQPVGFVGLLDGGHRPPRRRPQLGGLAFRERPTGRPRGATAAPGRARWRRGRRSGRRRSARRATPPGCRPTAARSPPAGRRRSPPRRATACPRARSPSTPRCSRGASPPTGAPGAHAGPLTRRRQASPAPGPRAGPCARPRRPPRPRRSPAAPRARAWSPSRAG